jgi:hypothetical protein
MFRSLRDQANCQYNGQAVTAGRGIRHNNNNIYLVRPPNGGWLHRAPRLRVAVMSAGLLRILNSLQTFIVCRCIVVTSARSGGPSKQCRQDLTVPLILKLGLLPFLNSLESSTLLTSYSHRRTSLQESPLQRPRVVRVLWEVLVPSSRMYEWEPRAAVWAN